MRVSYQFALDATVKDPGALLRAAMEKVQRKGGLTEGEALKLFKPGGKVISIQACLIEMLDPGEIPGCEIQNSDATHVAGDYLETLPAP